jgi:hypothetical protein
MVLIVMLVVVPFGAIAIVANVLLAMCEPKSRLGAVICFMVPTLAVLFGVIRLAWSNAHWLYPLFWPFLLRILGLVCIGIIAAGFAVAAGRRRQLRSKHDGVATSTI